MYATLLTAFVGNVFADEYHMKNDVGGKIILTNTPCTMEIKKKLPDGIKLMTAHATQYEGTVKEVVLHGCWFLSNPAETDNTNGKKALPVINIINQDEQMFNNLVTDFELVKTDI